MAFCTRLQHHLFCNVVKSTVKGIYQQYLSVQTGVNLLSAYWHPAKSTAPAPHNHANAAPEVQEAVGSNVDFVHPYHRPAMWPCTSHFTFSCLGSLLRINGIEFNSVTYTPITELLNKFVITYFSEPHSTPQDKEIMKDFLFILPNHFDETRIRKINGNLFPI